MTGPALHALPAVRRARGTEALFRDDSGNWFSLTQSKWAGLTRAR